MNETFNCIPELGILDLALEPVSGITFRSTPARSLQAALLRRLELISPDISQALHDADAGAPSTEHPWTVSSLQGATNLKGNYLVVAPDRIYRVRITALVPEVARVLDIAFNPKHPLGQEPLILEGVPFAVVLERTYWKNLATYASLLTYAKPYRRLILEFNSPTGFRSKRKGPIIPEPLVCIGGYLRKWNAFSDIPITEQPLMEFVENNISWESIALHAATQRLGHYSEHGFIGRIEWRAESNSPALLRQVNALVDYAVYCGTGMKTALGMGQTGRQAVK